MANASALKAAQSLAEFIGEKKIFRQVFMCEKSTPDVKNEEKCAKVEFCIESRISGAISVYSPGFIHFALKPEMYGAEWCLPLTAGGDRFNAVYTSSQHATSFLECLVAGDATAAKAIPTKDNSKSTTAAKPTASTERKSGNKNNMAPAIELAGRFADLIEKYELDRIGILNERPRPEVGCVDNRAFVHFHVHHFMAGTISVYSPNFIHIQANSQTYGYEACRPLMGCSDRFIGVYTTAEDALNFMECIGKRDLAAAKAVPRKPYQPRN